MMLALIMLKAHNIILNNVDLKNTLSGKTKK